MRKKAKPFYLNIATPCHENWGNMYPTESGMLCKSCQKTVFDFRSKSKSEIFEIITGDPSKISGCGIFHNYQLDQIYGVQATARRSDVRPYILAFAIGCLSFGNSNRSEAFNNMHFHSINLKYKSNSKNFGPEIKNKTTQDSFIITGQITQKFTGEMLQGVVVSINGSNISSETDEMGKYILKLPKSLLNTKEIEIRFKRDDFFETRRQLNICANMVADAQLWRNLRKKIEHPVWHTMGRYL